MGKVHGSMARAGKVRNQTPKVEKTERARKRQTGRAKKRLQYKKRIINVDPNDKRKKGPNFGAGKKVEEVPKWGAPFPASTWSMASNLLLSGGDAMTSSWSCVKIVRDLFFINFNNNLSLSLFKGGNVH